MNSTEGHIVVYAKDGTRIGVLAEGCMVGQVWGTPPTDDRMGKNDDRKEEERTGTIVVGMPLPDARQLVGKRVAVFTFIGDEPNG